MGWKSALGAVAGVKLFEKITGNILEKKEATNWNDEQRNNYCEYINNSITRISESIFAVQQQTEGAVQEITTTKCSAFSFKKKEHLQKIGHRVNIYLCYLYLAKEFFILLEKIASKVELQKEETELLFDLRPYMEDTTFLDMGEDELDIFLMDFEEETSRYKKKISEYVIPDVNRAICHFMEAMERRKAQKDISATAPAEPVATPVATPTDTPAVPVSANCSDAEYKCPNCHAMVDEKTRFCPSCGKRLATKGANFCMQCGKALSAGSKFCMSCGRKV